MKTFKWFVFATSLVALLSCSSAYTKGVFITTSSFDDAAVRKVR